jgi:hypothetical protein
LVAGCESTYAASWPVRAFSCVVGLEQVRDHIALERSLPIQTECAEAAVQAKVNRTANDDCTARIMGGARSREWFLSNSDVGRRLNVDLSSRTEIRIRLA